MRKLIAVSLCLFSSLAIAQSLTVGGGAVSGSSSASQAVAAVLIGPTGGTANMGAIAANVGTAQAAASTGLVIAPIPALVSGGTASSNNVTTIVTSGTVPVGASGLAGGSGSGVSFAGGGVIYYLTTTTPGPVAPGVLPIIGGPIIVPLPAF